MRALVLPREAEVRVTIRSRDGGGSIVSLDGVEAIPTGPKDLVRIRLVRDAVRFLRNAKPALPEGLPHKLGWSGTPRPRG
jgi:NAD kinase